jgi:uncharacterized protein (UPF0332 family)
VDKTALMHEVSNNLVLLHAELRSFVANAQARLWRKAITNLYYAAYNATRALLWSKGIQTESHDGAQSMLSLHFVKSGALPADTTKKLSVLMGLRHSADYKGDIAFDRADVQEHRKWTTQFVAASLKLVKAQFPKVHVREVEEALAQAAALDLDAGGAPARRKA